MIPLGAIELCFPPTSLLFSVSVDFPKVLIGLPTLPQRRGLHCKACLIVSVAGFRSVRPTEVNFQLAISEGMCFFPLLLQSSVLFLLTFPEKSFVVSSIWLVSFSRSLNHTHRIVYKKPLQWSRRLVMNAWTRVSVDLC